VPTNKELVALGDVGADLDLTVAPYSIEAFEPGVAAKRANFAGGPDTDGQVLVDDVHYDNVEATLRVRIWIADSTAMDSALAALGALVDKLQECERRDGGLPVRWTPANSTRTYTMYALLGAVDGLPIEATGDLAGWLVAKPVITIKLTRRPFLYGAEVTGATQAATGPVALYWFGDDETSAGDVAGEGRLIVSDTSGVARRHVEWGLISLTASDLVPATILDSDSLVTTGFSGTPSTFTGAYDPDASGNSVISAAVTARQTAVCATGNQSHVGTFRVKARIYTSASPVRVRLSWRAGDGALTASRYATPPVSANWCEVDLGLVTIPRTQKGTQQWSGQIEAMATSMLDDSGAAVSTHTLKVDALWLIPAGEGYGKVRAAYTYKPGPLLGTDDFAATTAGNALNGRTAPVGGAWVTGGSTTDFAFDDNTIFDSAGGETLKRASISDTGGRYATLGTATYAAVDVGAAIYNGTLASQVSGVVARYADTSNFLEAYLQPSAIAGQVYFRVSKVKAGTQTILAATGRFTAAFWYSIRLIAFASGTFIAEAFDETGAQLASLTGYDADLASGGTLAAGKVGLVDYNPSAVVQARYYDSFYVATPPAEPVVIYPNRRLEVRHDGNLREDSAGVSWGVPPASRGSRFLVPCAGDRALRSLIVVKVRRDDVDDAADTVVNDPVSLQVAVTPRYLAPR
jgi:hypothetical protein